MRLWNASESLEAKPLRASATRRASTSRSAITPFTSAAAVLNERLRSRIRAVSGLALSTAPAGIKRPLAVPDEGSPLEGEPAGSLVNQSGDSL
jgi:hypothetical protein